MRRGYRNTTRTTSWRVTCDIWDLHVLSLGPLPARGVSVDRSRALTRLGRAWEALTASGDGLSDAELMEPGVTGAWSVKDVVAYVTWWEQEAHLECLYFCTSLI